MPPLKVEGTVKAVGEVKVANGATVKLEAQPPLVLPAPKPDKDQAIQTTVTVFKKLSHRDGAVVSGWKFASGNAKVPLEQYCYYDQPTSDGNSTQQDVGTDGVISTAAGVTPAEQAARFLKCQWWQSGSL
jgi:hypothetical protein